MDNLGIHRVRFTEEYVTYYLYAYKQIYDEPVVLLDTDELSESLQPGVVYVCSVSQSFGVPLKLRIRLCLT